LQHLQDALLDEPIERRGNPELSDSTAALRYLHFPYRLRLVAAFEQLRPNA
jgi:hypothetical protein